MASNQWVPVPLQELPGISDIIIVTTANDTEGRSWPMDTRFKLGGKLFRLSAPQRGVNPNGGYVYTPEVEEWKTLMQKAYFLSLLLIVRGTNNTPQPIFIQEYRVQGVNTDAEWAAAIKKEEEVWRSLHSRTHEVMSIQSFPRIQES